MMKRTIKGFIGKVMVAAMKVPVIRASINQEGYVCLPAHMQMLKGADKQEDISEYPGFGEHARKAIDSGLTCLSYDRLYTIWQALMLSSDTRIINTAEVGVYKGGTSRFIVDVLNVVVDQKVANHFCFDTFEGHDGKDITRSETHKPGQFDDTSFEAVGKVVGNDCRVYQGRFEDTCIAIDASRFNFVHLDVDLFLPTLHALRFFTSRMKSDGIIVVDDYANTSCNGVKQAVEEFLAGDKSFIRLHLLTGQAILFKRG